MKKESGKSNFQVKTNGRNAAIPHDRNKLKNDGYQKKSLIHNSLF